MNTLQIGVFCAEYPLTPLLPYSAMATMIYQECATHGGWQEVEVESSQPDAEPYKVLLPPWDEDSDAEVVCECPGYIYRGHCRHQHEARMRVCNWNELDSIPQSTQQRNKYICPECGGPTRVVIEDE